MALQYTGKHSDTFMEAAKRYGLLPTIRTRLRDLVLLVRRLYLVKVWKMDIHPFTLISLQAILDRTYPRGIHVAEGTAISFDAVVLSHDHIAGKHTDTRIGKYCQVGARSMIMPGVTIGDHSVVAAAAIVTKDVPPRSIVAGNPARVIRSNIMTTNWGKITETGHKPGETPPPPEDTPETAAS
ncbi:acyltransferase [Dinoroseobacter sp. S76]|uniref:acyltransferase n=1 Tax=Dinoroseobacter sp. S76 TaxID=3415124 RepID=UPI003C7C5B3D